MGITPEMRKNIEELSKRPTKIGEIKGFPETGKTAWRSANDLVFIQAANEYNSAHGLSKNDEGYITPKLLKAWAMIESGGEGDKEAFLRDPLQVNNPDDWPDDDSKTKWAGLTKDQKMTPKSSVEAALKWFRYKAYIHDDTGSETEFRGIKEGLERYNRNPKKDKEIDGKKVEHYIWYAREIMELSK